MLYQYDPKKHNISAGGLPLTGFAGGTFLNIEANSDDWSEITGVYGDTTRIRLNDKSAIITLTLLYGSPGNTILDDFRKLDLNSGLGVFNFLADDSLNPGNQHIAATCYVRRAPTATRSDEAPTVEWTLFAPKLEFETRGGVLVA
jgi:hypothetical protein